MIRPIMCGLLPGGLVLGLLVLNGCASKEPEAPVRYAMPAGALAVDGPDLAVIGEYAGQRLYGTMARGAMAGFGTMTLTSTPGAAAEESALTSASTHGAARQLSASSGPPLECRAEIDSPPSPKARVHGILTCSGERQLRLTLRNLGPDQGLGIAKQDDESEIMVLFYHASQAEAERRFEAIKKDVMSLREQQGLASKGLTRAQQTEAVSQ